MTSALATGDQTGAFLRVGISTTNCACSMGGSKKAGILLGKPFGERFEIIGRVRNRQGTCKKTFKHNQRYSV
jgi:hypothetical protein